MKQKIKVKGMHCKSCELLITDSLNDLGVEAEADYKKGEVSVEFDPGKVTLKQIHKAIEENDYEVMG